MLERLAAAALATLALTACTVVVEQPTAPKGSASPKAGATAAPSASPKADPAASPSAKPAATASPGGAPAPHDGPTLVMSVDRKPYDVSNPYPIKLGEPLDVTIPGGGYVVMSLAVDSVTVLEFNIETDVAFDGVAILTNAKGDSSGGGIFSATPERPGYGGAGVPVKAGETFYALVGNSGPKPAKTRIRVQFMPPSHG